MDNNFEQHSDDKKDFNNSDDIMKNNKHNEVSPNNEKSSNNTTILTFTEIEALKEKLLDNKYEGDDSQKKKAIEQAITSIDSLVKDTNDSIERSRTIKLNAEKNISKKQQDKKIFENVKTILELLKK